MGWQDGGVASSVSFSRPRSPTANNSIPFRSVTAAEDVSPSEKGGFLIILEP